MGTPQTGSIEFDIAAREAQVVGEGPRIEAIPNDEIDAESWELVHTIRASTGASRATVMPEYMRTAAKHPAIFRCQMEMGTAIFQGRIPPRERELAVLRCGWLCRAPACQGPSRSRASATLSSDRHFHAPPRGSPEPLPPANCQASARSRPCAWPSMIGQSSRPNPS